MNKTKSHTPSDIADLERQITDLTRDNNRMRTLNLDMDTQIRDLLKRRSLTDDQWAEYVRQRISIVEMTQAQAEITVYLRTRYPSDFRDGGPHAGATFSAIVLRYLRGQ